MGMLKPVCVKCHTFYRMKKSGCRIAEGMRLLSQAPPGMIQPNMWRPYKIWMIDLWECHSCHNQIYIGSGLNQIAEHYQDGFKDALETTEFQVNDC
jgi:hypothetical protein